MLELFSDRARRILTLAQNDARARGHKSIHTCNLLIGFLIYGEGHAADILGKLGVKLDDVSSEIDRVYPRANVQTYGHIPTTSNTKKYSTRRRSLLGVSSTRTSGPSTCLMPA
jgi:ATP-dependent Clp protease ATP-binding subunit ClpC